MAHQKIQESGENIEEIYCSMISLCVHRFTAGIVSFVIAFSLGEQFTIRVLLAGFLTGLFVVTLGGIAVRQANLLANNLGINALRYTAPLFAILWLFLFRDPNYMNFAFLTIGTTAIIAANLFYLILRLKFGLVTKP